MLSQRSNHINSLRLDDRAMVMRDAAEDPSVRFECMRPFPRSLAWEPLQPDSRYRSHHLLDAGVRWFSAFAA